MIIISVCKGYWASIAYQKGLSTIVFTVTFEVVDWHAIKNKLATITVIILFIIFPYFIIFLQHDMLIN